jgi:quercetin dioxygenase-like cupin family protein
VSVFRGGERVAADGDSFSVHEWRGSGPPVVHVHHEDDEAWHVLEGSLRFQLDGRTVEAGAGTTVFVPAGMAHTYEALEGSRYLIVLTPRLRKLIAELQASQDHSQDGEIYRKHRSEIVPNPG